MKKVIAAALLCAVSSFATWDLFPAQDAGKGEAKLAFDYAIPAEKSSVMGLGIGARYSIIQGLEASVIVPYVISTTIADEDADISGLSEPIIGIRYWLPLGLGIAVDAYLPFGGEKVVGDEPQFALDAGLQFSTKFTNELSFGSEAMFTVLNPASPDASNGVNLNLAIELDYAIGPVTPYLGLDLQQGLTKGDKEEADKMTLGFDVGVIYDITSNFYASAMFWMGLAGDAYKDYAPKTIEVAAGIKF